jgi:16S rRNA processing protein RimM
MSLDGDEGAGSALEVVVARVGRPHGVRGELSLEVRTDEPERRFAEGKVLRTLRPGGGPVPPIGQLTVTATRWHQDRLLATFAEVTDRTDAEPLRGLLLTATVEPDDSPDDDEEFYDHQLVGLSVVTTTGDEAGTVADVLHSGGQDLLVVDRGDGSEALVPFVSALVPEVDLTARRVVVADRPGLLGPGEE